MLFGSQAQHFVALELDKFLGYFEWSKIAEIENNLFFLCSVSMLVMFVQRFTSRLMWVSDLDKCMHCARMSYLFGRRHQNRLRVLFQRQCSSMLSPQPAAAMQLVPSTSDLMAVQSQSCTSASSGGLSMGIVSSSRSYAHQLWNSSVFQQCSPLARITSMSQLFPDVLVELAELAQTKLCILVSSSTHVTVTLSASDPEQVSVFALGRLSCSSSDSRADRCGSLYGTSASSACAFSRAGACWRFEW